MSDNNKKMGLDNPAFESGNEVFTKTNGTVEDPENKGDERERAQWGNGLEFLMSCVAMSVGLGNIWRFPFTAYENGGGAFLIPYIIILTLIGRPLYYMEMSLGQFSNRGNIRFFKSLSPYLKGVGYAQVIGAGFVATYYCCLMAITLFYLVNSFTGDLPWSTCKEEWLADLDKEHKQCVDAIATTSNNTKANYTAVSSSEVYFTKEVLKEITDISDGIGTPEWRLTLCLLASWIITFLVSVKGVQSSGKASYFLALFPYVIMITLLIRAATLEGAADGMYYFIKTDWAKLAEADVWYAAVTQCFFSLNVGFGSIIMFASYNNFEHNINRDALIVTTLDTFTSLLSGATIFGILGNLAHNMGVTPDLVIKSGGTGLAFISYPDAIAKMEAVPWLFAILFFFMLFVLGVGSLVALHGTVNTVVQDLFPKLKSWQVSAYTASGGFLIGLMYVTPGGQFMLNLVDHYAGTFLIFVFAVLEVAAVAWVYGLENFCLDLEFMSKKKVSVYWRMTWGLITPALLFIIFVYFCVRNERLSYASYPYPDGVLAFGWAILGVSVAQFIMWIVYYIYKNRDYGFPEMVNKTFGHENWGPVGQTRRENWKKFKEDALQKRRNQNKSFSRKYLDALIGRQ
nr:PREDICTED: sodium-dependent nutrient amino acid transporter 1 [Tribolium castaneum]|eukprot:XP_008196787.1 PREDICTED: sodium-dependent nutrient amino acid transporter 1 [Tribolium castaneum]